MKYSIRFYNEQTAEWFVAGQTNSFEEAKGIANYYACHCERSAIKGDTVIIDTATGEILYYIIGV